MRYVGLLILLLLTSAQARIVSETEPNNDFPQSNWIACGDTVECAHLDISDGDFYQLTVPGGDSVYFRTNSCNGSNENTFILLYDTTHALLGYNNDSGPGQFSTLGVYLQANRFCYLQVVDPDGQSTGAYTLTIECYTQSSGPHGLCSNARPVTFFPYYDESSTFGGGDEIGTPAPDVFYELSLPTAGDVFVQVCSDAFDARVQLLTHCGGGLMDDASEGTCQLGADLGLYGWPAGTYWLLVEGTAANQFGEFTIEVSPILQECPVPQQLMIFDVGGSPFLDWLDVAGADYYAIEQSQLSDGPYDIVAITPETFWQDPIGYGLTRRFYRVRAVCE